MTIIAENDSYSFARLTPQNALLFTWKHVQGLNVAMFKKGIREFARQCEEHHPSKAVIDATSLDQSSPAVAWLRSKQPSTEGESYDAWWLREIVPKYNASGISGIAVATGDPSAPGELPELPEVAEFKMGYFPDLGASMNWQP